MDNLLNQANASWSHLINTVSICFTFLSAENNDDSFCIIGT